MYGFYGLENDEDELEGLENDELDGLEEDELFNDVLVDDMITLGIAKQQEVESEEVSSAKGRISKAAAKRGISPIEFAEGIARARGMNLKELLRDCSKRAEVREREISAID